MGNVYVVQVFPSLLTGGRRTKDKSLDLPSPPQQLTVQQQTDSYLLHEITVLNLTFVFCFKNEFPSSFFSFISQKDDTIFSF